MEKVNMFAALAGEPNDAEQGRFHRSAIVCVNRVQMLQLCRSACGENLFHYFYSELVLRSIKKHQMGMRLERG